VIAERETGRRWSIRWLVFRRIAQRSDNKELLCEQRCWVIGEEVAGHTQCVSLAPCASALWPMAGSGGGQ
jgi:hypothetical protein